ncbi:MAG: DoxX family protein [Burkholderiaceae bacterium]
MKLLAIPALIMPGLPTPVREWAYAGVALFLITAMIAHYAHGDPIALNLLNLLLIVLLVVSYLHFAK